MLYGRISLIRRLNLIKCILLKEDSLIRKDDCLEEIYNGIDFLNYYYNDNTPLYKSRNIGNDIKHSKVKIQ